MIRRARKEAENYRDNYGVPITGRVLADRVALYIHAHTLYSSYRPLGVEIFISAFDDGEYSLYGVKNNGTVFVSSPLMARNTSGVQQERANRSLRLKLRMAIS